MRIVFLLAFLSLILTSCSWDPEMQAQPVAQPKNIGSSRTYIYLAYPTRPNLDPPTQGREEYEELQSLTQSITDSVNSTKSGSRWEYVEIIDKPNHIPNNPYRWSYKVLLRRPSR